MLSRRASCSLLVASMCSAVTLDAAAHVSLDYPKSRYYVGSQADQSKLKRGPCGVSGDSRTTNTSLITTFKPGQTITVKWRETIQHPGFFRIAFDSDGQDFTLPGSASLGDGVTVLAEKIADKSGSNNLEYTYDITLPNTECAKCTLQLVQVMTTQPPPYEEGDGKDLYFNCADIVIKADGGGSGGAGGASTSGGSSGNNGGRSSGGTGGRNSGGMSAGGANSGGANNGGSNAAGGSGSGGQSGVGGSNAQGGQNGAGGSGQGGANPTNGGNSNANGGSSNASGGSSTSGGVTSNTGGASSSSGGATSDPPPADPAGCSCRVGQATGRGGGVLAALIAFGMLIGRRRRAKRSS